MERNIQKIKKKRLKLENKEKKILKHYIGFQHWKQLVDDGGDLGVTPSQITSKYPHIKGINFDLPHVVENAPSCPGI